MITLMGSLYEFYQSDDLKFSKQPDICTLKSALLSPQFLNFMTKITGIPLIETKIDISSHRYPRGGHLLCHDDDIADSDVYSRRIAFIIYLVPETWTEADGGQLQLFGKDNDNYPSDIVTSILPKWNSFAFFEVFPCSYHQVQEVFSKTDRMSIGGWLHGPKQTFNVPLLKPLSSPQSITTFHTNNPDLSLWINSTYLSKKSRDNIRDIFCDESCIELQDFLLPRVFQKVSTFINTSIESFTPVGPPNVRHFYLCKPNSGVLHDLIAFLASEAFKLFLQDVTGMELSSSPCINQLRMFTRSCYTLLQDQCHEPFGLDVNLSLIASVKEWDGKNGGATVYIADEETLITQLPKRNSLNLVYRDEGTFRFVKYINDDLVENRVDVDMVWI